MKIAASLFARVRNLGSRKPGDEPRVVAPQVSVSGPDLVGQAYLKFGPRVARHVARASRAKAPSEGPSRWALMPA